MLRRYARSNRLRLAEVARELTDRTLSPDAVLGAAASSD
jgi:hypothetical protein